MKVKLSLLFILLVLPAVGTLAMSSHKAMQQESTGQYVDNSLLTLKVKSKLLSDYNMKNLKISVTSYSGKVKLTGHVDTLQEKLKAGELAKTVEGVTGVINNITVMKTTK